MKIHRYLLPVALATFFLISIFGLSPFLAQTSFDINAPTLISPADSLQEVGLKKYQARKYREAIQIWEETRELFHKNQNLLGEANALNNMGMSFRHLSNFRRAVELHTKTLDLCTALQRYNQNTFEVIAKKILNSQTAFALHQQSLGMHPITDSKTCFAISWRNLASDYVDLGEFERAIKLAKQALSIFKQIPDRWGEGISLNNLGIVYDYIGKYDIAIDYYQQSLDLFKATNDSLNQGRVMNNLGITYRHLSKYQYALELFQEAFTIARNTGDVESQAHSLGMQGYVYRYLGEFEKAIDSYRRSLEIFTQVDDLQSQGIVLNGLGISHYRTNRLSKALELHSKAYEIFERIEDVASVADSLLNLGNTYSALGNDTLAEENFRKALDIKHKLNDLQGQVRCLNALGLIEYKSGKFRESLSSYTQGLSIAVNIGDREIQGNLLSNIASIFVKAKQPELAILFYKQSVNVREIIRSDIRKLDKQSQRSYLGTVELTYRNLVDLLLKQGRVTEALQVLDLLKIKELEDYLKNFKENDRTVKGVELLEPERVVSRQLIGVSFERMSEINRQLVSQIQQLPRSEINKVPNYLQKLPQGAALLYPLILDDRLEIILFAPNSPAIHRSVNINRKELEDLVLTFRVELRDYTSLDVKDSGKKLYDVLIKPIEEDLIQTKANTILYAPDGLFRYIPLAALYDGKQWLVEKYRINNLIAYSFFDQNSKPQSNPSIFAGAYGNSNQKLVSGFSQLPATIPEVNNIKSTFTNTTEITEQNFTAEASKNKAVGNAIVHLATHASFQSGSPLDSYILFGDGSKVTLSAISDWNLKNVDLVVLSACQTGLGTSANGAEILGFGYQVQKAGAKASIASLWTVSDGGTQLLMQAFYENLRKSNPSLSTSLREAQLSMIHRPVRNDEPNFNHPYFWSAFVLIGNGL
ncbi:MAG: hypothetical protein DCF19_19640 [Pseudanabaena frigida]|uniref:CHAT domain-containing protein n=1 Tax=Pseudanabaena frigida TaxID=945775 RepID=A0A2W4VXV2_9CYAN|nr:MAG: hypothetical protein DCF19_19640 [Pseudanabaena frigida]